MAIATARTTTSVSLLRILIRGCPLIDASRAWISRRVSVSSWLQGMNVAIQVLLEVASTLAITMSGAYFLIKGMDSATT